MRDEPGEITVIIILVLIALGGSALGFYVGKSSTIKEIHASCNDYGDAMIGDKRYSCKELEKSNER